ncbi:SDR family NAD(P)-dependent oxidoreductase [Vitiosangium sp. GDMCC 1.1324]|uniref:SDR family NAD(P)-dependent oxidoreductase n=1 Tax=Vitiosangium sp. (strain GDMCC 1.1324) TaxID=2138576 RepID=UPI000D3A170A|nr:SDR family oxidoreductase [Vitiosangium sp. GDMCC 1.1324]PTL83658.1 short-chain dehydrogenase [Vitiosangium sp. GDMCC 1.1324]
MSTKPLSQKAAVVTGGASGIGRAAALELAAAGASLVIADRDESSGARVVSELVASGARAVFQRTDVASFADVEAAVRRSVDSFGRIDVMFNNAGIGVGHPFLDWSPEEWERVIRVNQHGVFYGMLAAGRAMRAAGTGGVIINTGSIYGELATRNTIAYQAAKSAVEVMTKVAALELAPLGIRVVNVAPGVIDTPILDPYRAAGLIDTLAKKQMRGKLLEPAAVGRVVAFLASPAADGINGTTVFVDDGYSSFK